MRKVYIILLLLNLALSQYGGGSDSSYSSSSYDSSDSSYSSSSYDSSDSSSYYDSSYCSSSSISRENTFWDIVGNIFNYLVIALIISIVMYLSCMSLQAQIMEQTWEWERFMRNKIIQPAQYNIEEAKQLYLRTRWSIDFKQKNELYGSEISKVEINQINNSPSVHKLSLRGKDKICSWSASGFISFDDIIRIQFKKQYDNKERAGQTGNWQSLYYEGEMVSPHLIEGVWFYKGFEKHPVYSGTFKLKLVD